MRLTENHSFSQSIKKCLFYDQNHWF